jgi:carbon storage regulator
MLILSRQKREQIRIGDNIVITVQRIGSNRVSLGIEAPSETKIHRGELKPGPNYRGTDAGTQPPLR